jgi:hypothetical protein
MYPELKEFKKNRNMGKQKKYLIIKELIEKSKN